MGVSASASNVLCTAPRPRFLSENPFPKMAEIYYAKGTARREETTGYVLRIWNNINPGGLFYKWLRCKSNDIAGAHIETQNYPPHAQNNSCKEHSFKLPSMIMN
jgi:hypothetical protein